MKNLILIILAITVFILGSKQLIAQNSNNLTCNGGPAVTCEHSPTTPNSAQIYRDEIQDRFDNDDNPDDDNPWLTWNFGTNKGEFDCGELLNRIITGIDEDNFVVLNDQDYYESSPRVETGTDIRLGLGSNNECDKELYDEVTYETVRSHWEKSYFYYINNPDNDTKRFFLLTPGDYRDYEDLALYNGGTEDEKKYILYYDGKDNPTAQEIRDYFTLKLCTPDNSYHPDNRSDNKQAIIERFIINDIGSGRPEGNWVISGITIRGNHYSYNGNTGGIFSSIEVGGNIIKSCVFENIAGFEIEGMLWDCDSQRPRSYGTDFLRIDGASNNIITDCVFREKNECVPADDPMIDMIGILINGGADDEVSANNIIFDNDIKDTGDAIHMKPRSFNDAETFGAPGTLVYDNRLYNDKFYEVTVDNNYGYDCELERMNGEGAIDLKMGAGPWGCGTDNLDVVYKVIIANNEIFGWRRGVSGGGNGDAIHIHQNAKNIVVIDNNIRDCARGITIGGNMTTYRVKNENYCIISHAEHIEVYNNFIYDMYPSVEDGEYSGQKSCYDDSINNAISIGIQVRNESVVVSDNFINNCAQGISIPSNGKQAVITCNYMDGIYQNYLADNLGVEGDLENFTHNTFINFNTVCASNSGSYFPSLHVFEDNYFLCPGGFQIQDYDVLCPYSEEDDCPPE